MKRIYLDYNASTPLDPQILPVLIKELENEWGNPSSIHFHGKECRKQLEKSRLTIARFFQVSPQEIIFTSGGTEGAALLIQGILLQKTGAHVISSSAEHACVYQMLKEMDKKVDVTFLSAGLRGAVLPEDVERAILPETRLITLMAVNNETGVKTDLEAIAELAQSRQIPFIVDGVSWLGKEVIQIPAGVSGCFFSGHKIYAPKGIGFCICRKGLKLSPLFVGGGQEYNRRAGTENLPGIVALAEAVEILHLNQDSMIAQMRKLRDHFEKQLKAHLPDVVINGSGPRVSNTSNLAFLGIDGETLLMNLDREGISVSHGSACSSGALEPSRVLIEMGISLAQARSSLRFSLGRMTTEAEIESAIQIIVQEVKRLREIKNR